MTCATLPASNEMTRYESNLAKLNKAESPAVALSRGQIFQKDAARVFVFFRQHRAEFAGLLRLGALFRENAVHALKRHHARAHYLIAVDGRGIQQHVGAAQNVLRCVYPLARSPDDI